MKKLRKAFPCRKLKFFMCGEYGTDKKQITELGRPHYHAIIFGIQFPDLEISSKNKNGDYVYTSRILDKIWSRGFAWVGNVTFQSAGYVARYCVKKVNGKMAESHYRKIDFDTGEVYKVEPEFSLSSTREAIGKQWFMKYQKDLEKGWFMFDGKRMGLPAYYKKLQKEQVGKLREFEHSVDPSTRDLQGDRLVVREEVTLRRLNKLKRVL